MTDNQSDFITHLFDAISGDPSMPAELKISLLRLQLPVHKLSLSDPHFISNEKHPARRTLFMVRSLSPFALRDPSLTKKVDVILSSLIKSSPTAIHFAQINQRLELLEQNAESNKRNQPAENDKMLADDLKQQFNRKIKICIQGHQIPSSCHHLTLKLWPNALFYIFKNHGENSPHWINGINMYCDLLQSLQPILNIDQYRHLKDTFMATVRNNNKTMLLYHQKSIVEGDIKALISYFNHALGNTHYADINTSQPSKNVLEKISSLPADIKPGIWCEIYIDDITPPRRLRLSLINIETGNLIFVNRKGIKKIEKDAFEFSQELKNGLSKVYRHDALFSNPTAKAVYKKIG
ncbi:hypothetical protein MNBD_GAMMA09-541 [hydrothermal vent metagenome]|uniref:Uncharacterized protein n=1 Tax=hydrothermal vent metagenome TaxID=652676 RepID=A0A3B0X4V9_9ZZZZ